MSQPQPDRPLDGVDDLQRRREQRKRTPPPPRHPRPAQDSDGHSPEPAAPVPAAVRAPSETPAQGTDVVASEVTREIPREVASETTQEVERRATRPAPAEAPAPRPAAPAREVVVRSAPAENAVPFPSLNIDLTDPQLMIYSPTVLSVPADVRTRFERAAKASGAKYTAQVLEALRGHAQRLPELVLGRRPGPRPGDLFPQRAVPGEALALHPGPLRIRPTVGEMKIMDVITEWVDAEVQRQRPGARVTRSEVVTAALDAFLPAPESRKRKTN